MANTTQSVGKFTAVLSHPLINGGASIALSGFKLDSQFISTAQSVENSKRVPLVDNTTAGLTNSQRSGRFTWTCTRKGDITAGDVVRVSQAMVAAGDSIGGTLTITTSLNGVDEKTIFYNCTCATCPPLMLAGNNVPDYTIVWDYADLLYLN
jgi:hypothetical protein